MLVNLDYQLIGSRIALEIRKGFVWVSVRVSLRTNHENFGLSDGLIPPWTCSVLGFLGDDERQVEMRLL